MPSSAIAMVLALSFIAYVFLRTASSGSETSGSGPGLAPLPGGDMIGNNPLTWPSGDRIWDIARAIAKAEGYDVSGSNPNRLNNPGDISDGFATYGGEAHSGSNITKFPSASVGWQWLYDKLERAVTGGSSVYSPDMTWDMFAQVWAADWTDWVNIVTSQLGVERGATIGDYYNGNY